MVFSSLTFLFLFLPVFFTAYFLAPKFLKNLLLFLGGLVFYAWGEPRFILIMLLSTLVDYSAGLFIDKFDGRPNLRKAGLLISVIMNLSILGLFKYGGFVTNGLIKLPLPIGISFYTFQTMSYTIDLYRRNIKVQKNPINFGAFVTMFPQIVAGPIVRYADVDRELNYRTVTADGIYSGIMRFVAGLGKKVILANGIGLLWDAVKTTDISKLTAASAWLGIIAFTFQIYFDFSGYSDMAIGLGRIMGFNFPENFDYPYSSRSVSEFWRRWHMTLGSWFKSYVYIPLGGSRKGMSRTVVNLAVVWLLTGIWHGANWTFILWGVLYGAAIIAEKLFLGKILAKLPAVIANVYTMFLVILGWVLFSMPDLTSAGRFIGVMFGAGGKLYDVRTAYLAANYGVMLVICLVACTKPFNKLRTKIGGKFPSFCGYAAIPVSLAVFVCSAAYLATQGYNPFLYFNF